MVAASVSVDAAFSHDEPSFSPAPAGVKKCTVASVFTAKTSAANDVADMSMVLFTIVVFNVGVGGVEM